VVHQFGQDYGHSFSPSIIAFSGELAFFAAGMDHWMGPLSALDPGNPATEAAAFFAAAPDHAPWYAHPQYGWIFSESSRWPWIYSADAGAWLYVHGNNRFVLWMWSAQYGWILTRPPYWPWFWSADLREWRHWGDR
jgi:hypothetical protein